MKKCVQAKRDTGKDNESVTSGDSLCNVNPSPNPTRTRTRTRTRIQAQTHRIDKHEQKKMAKRDTYKTGEGTTNDARCYSMAHQTIQYSYDL